MRHIITIFALLLSFTAYADIDIDRIIAIESSGDPLAYNKHSKATGLMQITPVCLADWNALHNKAEQYTMPDMFDPQCNMRVGYWYINERIPAMLKHYGIADTTTTRLIAYNWGIGGLVRRRALPRETINYINKYNQR